MALNEKDYQDLQSHLYFQNRYKDKFGNWVLKPPQYYESYTEYNNGYAYHRTGGFIHMNNYYEWGDRVIAIIPNKKITQYVTLIAPLIDEKRFNDDCIAICNNRFYSCQDLIDQHYFLSKIVTQTDDQKELIIGESTLLFKRREDVAFLVWKLRHKGEHIKIRKGYEKYPELDFLYKHNAINNPTILNNYLPEILYIKSNIDDNQSDLKAHTKVQGVLYILIPQNHAEWMAFSLMTGINVVCSILSDRLLVWIFSFICYILYNLTHKEYWYYT